MLDNTNKKPYNDIGQRHGIWVVYWTNGNLQYKGNYINGKENGLWQQYFSDLRPFSQGNYINAQPYGYWEVYFLSNTVNKQYYAR